MSSHDRIVVGIEFDECSESALAEALRLASRGNGTEVHAVHVINDPAQGSSSVDALARKAEALEVAPHHLAVYVRQRLPEGAHPPVMLHVRIGPVAEALLRAAADLDAGLIVVGTHGRRGLSRLVLGSVAQELLAIAHCPVLIARPRDFTGVERSAGVEPPCVECTRVRAAGGATAWCDYHSRPQIRPHAYSYSAAYGVGGHDPGVVPANY